MDKKPSVFPTPEQRQAAMAETSKAKIEAYEAAKIQEANGIYQTAQTPQDTPQGHISAVEQMRQRTEYQLAMRNRNGDYNSTVQHPELAENANTTKVVQDQANLRNEELMRLRDEQLRKNQEQIAEYQRQANMASARNNNNPNTNNGMYPQNPVNYNNGNNVPPTIPPSKPPINNGYGESYGQNPSNINPYILELSQPNYNAPFDVIPLPSKGKLYREKKPNIRLAYLTTADENILTSPNLLQSGEFLEILINRKMLEPGLRYKDLHVGDRNAIMIWLRATGYGEMYPVTLLDEKDVPFETEINLNDLKTKELGAEPDEEGLFYFEFPLCKAKVKFKLLTCGDIDEIERLVEADKVNNVPVNNTTTYTKERTIVEVNGARDKYTIKEFANAIRIMDAMRFNDYVSSIESGIDLDIEVGTPGGSSIKTFLPLNINFFWPNIKL